MLDFLCSTLLERLVNQSSSLEKVLSAIRNENIKCGMPLFPDVKTMAEVLNAIGGQLYREGWIFLAPPGASRIARTQDGLEFTDDPESDAQPFAVSAVAKIVPMKHVRESD